MNAALTGSGQAARAADSVTITTGDFTLTLTVGEDTYSFQMLVNAGVSTVTVSLNGEEQSSHEFAK